ncbi:MAG: RNA polymerase sigma factor [Myxococcales bacterium]
MPAATDSTTAPSASLPELEVVLGAHVERLKQRDLESFDEIYRLTRHEVARVLFHLAGPNADLERLVGDAYLALFEQLQRLPSGTKVRPVLHRVCTRLAQQRPPLFRRRQARDLDLSSDPKVQAAHLLHQALAQMPAKDRVVFVLGEVLGLSAQEVQAAAELSPSAVNAHLRRARLSLTEALRFADEAETEVVP